MAGQGGEVIRHASTRARTLKKQYQIKVASQVKTDPKGFFQAYKTKSRELVSPLKIGQEEMVSLGEDMCKVLNDYFLSVFLLRKTKT